LISAGLRTDVKTLEDKDVKELVEQAIPKNEVLRLEGRKVLEALDIVYTEPTVIEMLNATIGGDDEDPEDFEYGSVSDEIDDTDYSGIDSDGYDGFDFFPGYMEGEEDEENEENDQGEQDGEGGWGDEGYSSDFDDDYDDDGHIPIPVPFLFGLLM
jgi:hypothetical protein